MSPTDSMTVQIDVSGNVLQVERVVARFAVNQQFSCRVSAVPVSGDPPEVSDLLGKPAKLTLTSPLDETLVVRGLVRAVERHCAEEEAFGYQLDVAPEVTPLTIGKNHLLFQDQSIPDIVKSVLNKANIDAGLLEWRLAAHKPRKYVVQYGESDWEFIERILADEGINYAFLFTEDSTKLSFFDDSSHAPAIEGDADLPLFDASMLVGEASVTEVTAQANMVTSGVRLRDYNPENPPLELDEQASSGTNGLEFYDSPGRFEQPSDGKGRAQMLLDAVQRERRMVRGRSNCLRVATGHTFTLKGHPVPGVDGPLFVTRVELSVRQGLAQDPRMREGFELRFSAVPKDCQWRPLPHQPRIMPGPQTAVVCGPSGQEIHTNDHGQIRPQFYWDREGKRDDKSCTWMRVGQFPLGFSMMLPRIHWDQIVAYGSGNADAPVVVGHLYDAKEAVPYALPANKTRTAWQTNTTPGDGTANEIRFEDKAGSEEMFINASRDMTVEVGHDSDAKVDVNHDTTIGVNQDIKVGANQSNTVKGSQTVKVGVMETLTVSGSRSLDVGGDETETVGAARTVTVSSGATLDVDNSRTVTVGAVMMSTAGMSVDRAALGSSSITVGGAWVAAAGTGIEASAAGISSETVGGLKLQAAGGDVNTSVKGTLIQNVGAALINSAKGNMSETSGKSLTIKVGAAMAINGPDVLIEAKSKISIQVGATSLTIESGKIELKSPNLASPGATIAKKGSTVEHNP